MNNLQVLLLEDLDDEAKELSDILEENNYDVIRAKNTEEAEKEIENHFFDIIILDIMIDGKEEGISLAQCLNKKEIGVPFLFLTSMQSKVFFEQAKLTNPYSYLLKPYNELEILYAMELAIETHYQQKNTVSFNDTHGVLSPTYLFVKNGRSVVKIQVASIHYLEVNEKYCSLKCDEGEFVIRMSLRKVLETLPNHNLKQVHRKFVVNFNQIKEIYFDDNLIIMKSQEKVPFSDRYKVAFKKDNIIFN